MKFKHILIVLAVIIVIGLGYYGISPIFRNVKVDEAVPQSIDQEMEEVSGSADVIGTIGHPASGTARIVEVDGTTYVRYENFKTLNGPDLYVYLSKDIDAKEFVDLGRVRATEGNINYEVPVDVNTSEYPYVLTWCRRFSVLFNYADLSQAK